MSRRPGQPPKPTELKVLQGNPGKRPLADKVEGRIPATIPRRPIGLGRYGRAAWTRYWTAGRAWLAESDVPLIQQLCQLHDEYELLRGRIRDEGLLQISETTGRSFTHSGYNDLRGLRREMRELWSLAYMTPTDRGRASVKLDKDDPLAEWLEGSRGSG